MTQCLCVAEHRPGALTGEVHHIWPKGMGGPDVEANRVFLCSNAHTNVHDILRYMVKDQKYLSYSQVQALYPVPVNRYAFQLALLGFRRWKNGTLVAP